MRQEEINNTYYLVESYLQQKEEKQLPTAFDKLTTTDKLLALTHSKLIYKKAITCEKEITLDLIDMQAEIGDLKGIEHRVKPFSSLLDKVVSDASDYKGSFQRAANNISDSVRYTFVIPDEEYITKIDECLHKLELMGYQVIEVKNNWNNIEYKGINVRLTTKNNEEIFEIQFHTPIAYRIKEGDDNNTKSKSTRNLYLVVRDKTAPEWLRAKANRLRIYLQSFINIPDGAIDYEYNSEIRRKK